MEMRDREKRNGLCFDFHISSSILQSKGGVVLRRASVLVDFELSDFCFKVSKRECWPSWLGSLLLSLPYLLQYPSFQ